VLAAAGTKWNFHKYHPGLVGGHCIGVDPYYLTHRAVQLGYHPEVILAGRRINDSMGEYVGELVVRGLNAAGRLPREAHVWMLGLTFKENVPDLRNSRAADVLRYLKEFGVRVSAWEPMVDAAEIRRQFGVETLEPEAARDLDAVVLINGHQAFRELSVAMLRRKMRTPVLVDAKNFFPGDQARALGFHYSSL
jgi:UDP-N-acetyl-D-galactosamine dehydrogenase